jgi:hypothetical protein
MRLGGPFGWGTAFRDSERSDHGNLASILGIIHLGD